MRLFKCTEPASFKETTVWLMLSAPRVWEGLLGLQVPSQPLLSWVLGQLCKKYDRVGEATQLQGT